MEVLLPAARSYPMRRALRPGSPPDCAHTTDRVVPARCAPRTTGPSAAPRRTRASRGGRATTASPSSRLRHRGGLPIKTERRPTLRAPHQAVGRHCRPRPAQPSRPATFRPPLGHVVALGLTHCLAKSPTRRRTEPLRPPQLRPSPGPR
jgi:hypothetical protein